LRSDCRNTLLPLDLAILSGILEEVSLLIIPDRRIMAPRKHSIQQQHLLQPREDKTDISTYTTVKKNETKK
jgi:hypothetical protein